MTLKVFKIGNNKVIKSSSNKANKIIENLIKSKKLKSIKFEISIYMNIKITKKPIFLTFSTKEVVNFLKQVFLQISIF